MKFELNGDVVYVATGGQPFNPALPTVVFLHGSGGDHRTWSMQSEWFAKHGYSVVAPDYPAHSRSGGSPLTSIEQSADWLQEVLTVMGITAAHLVGHSQGFLTALQLTHQTPETVMSLTGVATAATIPVNPSLIETASKSVVAATDLMLQWGFGPQMHIAASSTPSKQVIALSRAIMETSPLVEDLQCCATYQSGEEALTSIKCPCAMILGGLDKMTPMQAGKATAEKLGAKLTVLSQYGHMLPMEAPREVLAALKAFIAKQTPSRGD